jgi:hypothetical protein
LPARHHHDLGILDTGTPELVREVQGGFWQHRHPGMVRVKPRPFGR